MLPRTMPEVRPSPKSGLRLAGLAAGVFAFFLGHNFAQEALIVRLPGLGAVLGLLEVLGVMVCSGVERQVMGQQRIASPLRDYVGVCLCLLGSSALSNIALNYINYPTKVIFRSSKLIPTMAIAVCLNGRTATLREFLCAACVTLGLILFALGDWEVSPQFNVLGMGLVVASTIADSLLPNLQERLFKQGSSRVEVTFVTNVLVFACMSLGLVYSGDVAGAIGVAQSDPSCLPIMVAYVFLAYGGITLHMQVVKEFGSIVAVLVGNTRKALTIVLSFIIFQKPFSMNYPLGGLLVLGGLTAYAISRKQRMEALPAPR